MFEMSKSDSFFRPYLAILPHIVDSVLFWSADELAELENTNVDGMNHEKITKEFNKKVSPHITISKYNIDF